MTDLALTTLEQTLQEFHVDPSRLFLTGMSMGGAGVWRMAHDHPELFAALITVCGALKFPAAAAGAPNSPANLALCAELAEGIGKRPVWIFHGAKDPIVPVEFSRQMQEALRHRGCPVRYTEFPEDGHGIWDKVYDAAEVSEWLFAQQKR